MFRKIIFGIIGITSKQNITNIKTIGIKNYKFRYNYL